MPADKFDPSPYVGKKFVHGIDDCYSLVREFYEREFGLQLTNYARPDNWWNDGGNLYMDNFKKEGFYIVDELEDKQFGDLFLIAFGAKVACHAAIYVGDNKILHHVTNRLSTVDKYAGCWRNWTLARIRHISNKKDIKERTPFDWGRRV